ncbi:CaiB/BaiF CoA transferase family protein [Shimia ponticola]|uniref:CaiB/BaiF CoA transferase family protein n=1 Tax=Shimia ponticola TaxID=2582893 RepID=UPI0011BE9510|nr:CoA transferase [Shimia ponticola]
METSRPLVGTTVLDLTNVLAGPFACHQLAHLGADVIKVEAVGRGDLARGLGASPELSAKGMGISFLAQNAGKRSITVNLKTEGGRDVLKRLVRSADVLVENFRPSVMERLGVGAEVLRAENPKLIYCAISGFGQTGPWAKRPAYDQIIQGAAGVMEVTGTQDSGPTRVGYPLADTVGGLTAALAISAALNAPDRGCVIDVSMLEAVLATMGWVISNHIIGGVEPTRNGNENPTSAPSGAFQCADGLINIAANKEEQWQALAEHLNRADLLDDPDFATREDRKTNRLRLRAELETVLTTKPASEWEAELNSLGVPAGAVLSVPDVLAHDQIRQRELFGRFADVAGVTEPIDLLRVGMMIDSKRPSVNAPPPELGGDTDDVLGAVGYSPEDISKLRKEGAV